MSKQEQVLTIKPPNELTFVGPFTQPVSSVMYLSNPSERKVCFKIKTTAPKRYCVKPNSGIIGPSEQVKISVSLQPFEFVPAEKNKHKFMVQSMYAPEGEIHQDLLWKEVDTTQLMDSKLKCVFVMPDNNGMSAGSAGSADDGGEYSASSSMPSITASTNSHSGKFPMVIGREFTPHIANTIFNLLDKQDLTKSRSVSSTWKDVVDSRTNLWTDPELYRKAAIEGNLEMCQMIIEKIDNKNPTVERVDFDTPLHIAARKGHVEIARLILDHLEKKNPKKDNGETPLHCAARADNPVGGTKIYRLIMNEVQDKNPKDKTGWTPLHRAAMYGNFEVSKLIVESVDEKNPADEAEQTTPLHLAAECGNTDIFRLIFEKVQDKNPPDSDGNTPLHFAACNGHVEACRLIIAHVDNKQPVNHQGETPLDWARDEEPHEFLGDEELQVLEQLWLEGEELQGLEQLWLDEEKEDQ